MRYLRLYAHFVKFSFSRAMEFRLDFFFRIVMDCVFYAVQLGFFRVLYDHTDFLGGWTIDQVYVFVAGFLFVDAVHMTVFANNTWWFPTLVNRGDLDYHLVRPVSSLFMLSVREFAANSFLNLVIASAIVVWALVRYPDPLGGIAIAVYLALLLVGAFLYYVLHMISLVPVFWLHSAEGLREIFLASSRLSERPHQIFGDWLRRALTSFVPFALIASWPAHLLFDGLAAGPILHSLGVAAAAFATLVLFWRRGLRAYSSASS